MLPSICHEYYYIDLLFSNHGNLPLKLSTLKFSCGPKITKSGPNTTRAVFCR